MVEDWVVSDAEAKYIAINMTVKTERPAWLIPRERRMHGSWEEMWCGHCVSIIRVCSHCDPHYTRASWDPLAAVMLVTPDLATRWHPCSTSAGQNANCQAAT